jgi:WhiB family redox-sensing transcriptional regulator
MSNLRVKLWAELNRAIDEMEEPECRRNPNLFDLDLYTDQGTKRLVETQAKSYCGRCPAKNACALYAVAANEEAMIWGGLTPAEREVLKSGK